LRGTEDLTRVFCKPFQQGQGSVVKEGETKEHGPEIRHPTNMRGELVLNLNKCCNGTLKEGSYVSEVKHESRTRRKKAHPTQCEKRRPKEKAKKTGSKRETRKPRRFGNLGGERSFSKTSTRSDLYACSSGGGEPETKSRIKPAAGRTKTASHVADTENGLLPSTVNLLRTKKGRGA